MELNSLSKYQQSILLKYTNREMVDEQKMGKNKKFTSSIIPFFNPFPGNAKRTTISICVLIFSISLFQKAFLLAHPDLPLHNVVHVHCTCFHNITFKNIPGQSIMYEEKAHISIHSQYYTLVYSGEYILCTKNISLCRFSTQCYDSIPYI